ncbi:glycine zipper 2TM domain-containing protein [Allosphingosinicella indica]|uniref:17 kDa surface antigen n=1 Tax=Allosphingosinicella indica TaxID=941907 RepID=A0A1X7FZB0_9SPHN|nr:glycine zipper 2TM domain-containing protein [Allosphingosinicella indica]SMF61445.1 Glycine zipper 2TM domain-containing protein [Allosphingosinicella indica]
MRKIVLAIAATSLALPVAMPAPAMAKDGYYNGKTWRGKDGRMHCRRKNGTTGLIVGGAAGALAGRAIDGGQNRATGTIVGAAAGALLGREVDKSRGFKCR